ncbi:hypothetical protein D0T53_07130 [Dysgonomonas sp. 216]|nr:hypothetical protein [Dysgonomonas sp. 216]NDW18687.1 hypothetical protein [Dysgonomonas sp. 216]
MFFTKPDTSDGFIVFLNYAYLLPRILPMLAFVHFALMQNEPKNQDCACNAVPKKVEPQNAFLIPFAA